jgi:DNA-binding transcriptional regulator/RsmH inhibitor MraZ
LEEDYVIRDVVATAIRIWHRRHPTDPFGLHVDHTGRLFLPIDFNPALALCIQMNIWSAMGATKTDADLVPRISIPTNVRGKTYIEKKNCILIGFEYIISQGKDGLRRNSDIT